MPYVASIGTHLPCWRVPQHRVADDDVAQVHDFFTGVDLIGYEDLGFAEVTTVGDGLRVDASDVTILEGAGCPWRIDGLQV